MRSTRANVFQISLFTVSRVTNLATLLDLFTAPLLPPLGGHASFLSHYSLYRHPQGLLQNWVFKTEARRLEPFRRHALAGE